MQIFPTETLGFYLRISSHFLLLKKFLVRKQGHNAKHAIFFMDIDAE